MKKMNPAVHFEMAAGDRQRAADFYSKVFGWKSTLLGEEMGNYVTVETSACDGDGRPSDPEVINGGFYMKTETNYHEPSVVIAFDDINESIKEVNATGGRVLGEPMDIPRIGQFASFIDTEGNRVSMLQALLM